MWVFGGVEGEGRQTPERRGDCGCGGGEMPQKDVDMKTL